MSSFYFRIGAALCFLAVALGAFGAHALKPTLESHGMTVVWRSLPWARPQAVTVPRYLVWAMALARVWLPTESTTAPQRSFWKGLPGSDSSPRWMKSSAPSLVR